MDVLIRFGFSIEEIKNMMDTNEELDNVDDSTAQNLIQLLCDLGCSEEDIKNIFICNPFFLSRAMQDVKDLITRLKSLGIRDFVSLFDSNPYLLNGTVEDFNVLYESLKKEGYSKKEILESLILDFIL